MFGTEALDLAGLVVSSQFHTQGTGALEALPRNDAAIVAAAPVVYGAQVCRRKREIKGLGISDLNTCFMVVVVVGFAYK